MPALIFRVGFLSALLVLQVPTIRPDGAVSTTTRRKVDLSVCDTVIISGPVARLSVSDGKFTIYGFKEYGGVKVDIECEVKGR